MEEIQDFNFVQWRNGNSPPSSLNDVDTTDYFKDSLSMILRVRKHTLTYIFFISH